MFFNLFRLAFMSFNQTWNEASPAGTDYIRDGDNVIRAFKSAIRERLAIDHYFVATEAAEAYLGFHKQVSLIEAADIGTGETGYPILGAQTTDGIAELLFTNEADNDVQLTKGDYIFGDNVRMTNDAYLTAIDNAGTGSVDMIKVDTNDVVVVPDGIQNATSAAPDDDEDLANKKYVDDQITASVPGVTSGSAKSVDTSYLAATDGFAIAVQVSAAQTVEGFTDVGNPPTTLMAVHHDSDNDRGSITFPVKEGDYWKITHTETAPTVYWVAFAPA